MAASLELTAVWEALVALFGMPGEDGCSNEQTQFSPTLISPFQADDQAALMACRRLGSRQHESRPVGALHPRVLTVTCQGRHGGPEMPWQRSCKWPLKSMHVLCRVGCKTLRDQWQK